ncbi:MAG: ABC transporter permease [Bacilli bacterium]
MRKVGSYWQVYVMMIPIIVFFLIFAYRPMYGIVIAFKDYMPSKGIMGSKWVGFEHFRWVFTTPEFGRAFRNTLIISFAKLFFCFPFPIIVALLLNEIPFPRLKKAIQTSIYLPYFISWVIIGTITYDLLNVNGGLVNNFLMTMGFDRINFLTDSKYFLPIVLLTEMWKNAGWGSIIYLSAISGVNQDLYEAAELDGCGRFRKMWHVTLPSISPIVIVMFLLAVGNVMNAGFDQIFNLYNASIYDVADIIDTLAYRVGISQGFVERGGALGLFKTVINLILLLSANFVVKKINGVGIYE